MADFPTTRYFDFSRQRPDRAIILNEWIVRTFTAPEVTPTRVRAEREHTAAGCGDWQPRKPLAFSGVAQVEKGQGRLFPCTTSKAYPLLEAHS
jgi:hypothetical protein